MISFDEFKAKWNGRGIDFDGYYGDQCMDLMHQYISEVLGLTDGRILAAPTASQVFTNFPNVYGSDLFDRIYNTPDGVPQKGDILFFKQYSGIYGAAGHVAIYDSGDLYTIHSFDQNFPTGTKCHIQNHNYNGSLGWLRRKKQALTDAQKLQKVRDIAFSNAPEGDKVNQIKSLF